MDDNIAIAVMCITAFLGWLLGIKQFALDGICWTGCALIVSLLIAIDQKSKHKETKMWTDGAEGSMSLLLGIVIGAMADAIGTIIKAPSTSPIVISIGLILLMIFIAGLCYYILNRARKTIRLINKDTEQTTAGTITNKDVANGKTKYEITVPDDKSQLQIGQPVIIKANSKKNSV